MLGSPSFRNDQRVVYTLCVNSSDDRSHDNLIHCLKEGQPCFQGRKVLGSQLKILQNENNIFKNPSESGVDKTYESCQLLYQQEEDDEGIDIL